MATNNSINNVVTGTNTGDEDVTTIKSKLSITTLSGSNTGDQDLSAYATTSSLSSYQLTSQKDASGGYVGLTLFKINFKNVLGTFTSFFTNSNTAARTYTFKDADGTIAFTSDITGTNSGTNTGDQTTTAGLSNSTDKNLVTDAQLVVIGNTSGTNTGDNSANTRYSGLKSIYRSILQSAGSHIATRVAGTYFIPLGDPIGITGTGTLYPPSIIRIDSADYPTIDSLAPKFRIKWSLMVNDVAPTGNFTIGLYPITRPATSGGAGLDIYTMGTVVSGSNGSVFTAPIADSMNNGVSSDFALPADGYYVLGVVTSATVAASSHLHFNAQLQAHNA